MRSCRKENIVKSAENGQSFAFSATTHKLIIAEKPSVAKNIVEALEDQDEFKKKKTDIIKGINTLFLGSMGTSTHFMT